MLNKTGSSLVGPDGDDRLHQVLDEVQDGCEWQVHNYCTIIFDWIEAMLRKLFN